MNTFHFARLAQVGLMMVAAPAFSATVTVGLSGGTAPYPLGSSVWATGKLDGVGRSMTLSVNGIPGG
ncbi:MAG TPA: hypothetical protein VF800_31005, partial [Telluria sp.]